tara:strand:+ start:2035 stop:2424 length:390 start_codon:yes stop_codon:yes gene_type:complete
MLSKVKTFKIKCINLNKGKIIKLLNKKDKFFKGFGECYLNEVKKNNVKGWNYHTKNTCILFPISGKFLFTFTINFKNKKNITVEKNKPKLIFVPPKTWFKFKSLTNKAVLMNVINNVHRDSELKKKLIK